MNFRITIDISQSSALYILACSPPLCTFRILRHYLFVSEPTLSLPPGMTRVSDLHTHEYTAVQTRGQHPFSPLHISSLYIHVYCRYREYITDHIHLFQREIKTVFCHFGFKLSWKNFGLADVYKVMSTALVANSKLGWHIKS